MDCRLEKVKLKNYNYYSDSLVKLGSAKRFLNKKINKLLIKNIKSPAFIASSIFFVIVETLLLYQWYMWDSKNSLEVLSVIISCPTSALILFNLLQLRDEVEDLGISAKIRIANSLVKDYTMLLHIARLSSMNKIASIGYRKKRLYIISEVKIPKAKKEEGNLYTYRLSVRYSDLNSVLVDLLNSLGTTIVFPDCNIVTY